jgi:ABC-type amino acid transport substrate-binding protein/nitrogen-specific signal transduction histidine kinase
MLSSIKSLILSLLLLTTTLFANETLFTQKEKEWIKNNPKVTIVMLNDYLPFSFVENGVHRGFSLEVLNEISKTSGLQFDIKTGNWAEILENFKSGKVDMISDISHTKERESFSLFTTPYYEIPTFIFGYKSDKIYVNNESLRGKRVAVTKNIFYKDDIQKLGIQIVECDTSLEKVQMVLDKKADYFLDPYIVGKQSLESVSSTNLKVMDEFNSIKKEDLRFGITKNKAILLSIIQKSYDVIKANELINLSNKWMMNIESATKNSVLRLSDEEKKYLETKPVITYSEVDWQPLSIIEKDSMSGIMGDYLKLVAQKTGLNFKYVPSKSWPDVLDKFSKKEIDLVPGVGTSDEEVKLGLMSDKYASYPMVIVTKEKYKFVDSLHQFDGKIVAIPQYYTSYNFVKKHYPQVKILATKDIEEALLKVNNGEAEAFVGHIATSLFYLSKLYLKDLKVAGTTDFSFEHHYLVQKENPLLLSIVNKAFASITEKEKQTIYNNWVQTTVVQETLPNGLLFKIFVGVILFFLIMFYFQKKLTKEVAHKTEELRHLNEYLEEKIKEEVEKNITTQQQLFKAEKLASLGEMIGNIAHQWRQPLSVISTAATGLQLQKESDILSDANFDKYCNAINENAQYLSKTIEDFRDFIQEDRDKNSVFFNLVDTVNSFLSLVDSSVKNHNLHIVLDMKEAIFLHGHPNELIQCFMNIFSNAKYVLKAKEDKDRRYIFITTAQEDGRAIVTIKDNGGGIQAEHLSKVFEPYFTTKHKSQGTGLGLHMTYNLVVHGMGGKIEVANATYTIEGKPEKGALFTISLPMKKDIKN